MSSGPTRHRSSRTVQPPHAHSRRKGAAKTFRGQPQSKPLLNREARQSKNRGSGQSKGQPSVSSRRQGQARKTFRKVRERRRSDGAGKGRRKIARKVTNEARNAIGDADRPCIFALESGPNRPIGFALARHYATGARRNSTNERQILPPSQNAFQVFIHSLQLERVDWV